MFRRRTSGKRQRQDQLVATPEGQVAPTRQRRRRHKVSALRAMAVAAVPVLALAALSGTPSQVTFPLLLAAMAAFLVSTPADVFGPGPRTLDIYLALFVSLVVFQLVPLPSRVASTLSPREARLNAVVSVEVPQAFRTLSIDDRLTIDGLATAAAGLLVFWAARNVFSQGRLRAAVVTIALAGGVAAAFGVIQRITSPYRWMWAWPAPDPAAAPFGVFTNRNHFATWLIMAVPLVIGALLAHAHARQLLTPATWRHRLGALIADAKSRIWIGATALMTAALVATLSLDALAGLAVAAPFAYLLSRKRYTSARFWVIGIGISAMTVLALAAASTRVTLGSSSPQRADTWRTAAWIVGDFPLAGTGVGTYARASTGYRGGQGPETRHAQNEWLQLGTEGGALLAAPALGALIVGAALIRRRLNQDARETFWIRLGAWTGLSAALVQSVWESSLRVPANALLFALLAGIAMHERETEPGISS